MSRAGTNKNGRQERLFSDTVRSKGLLSATFIPQQSSFPISLIPILRHHSCVVTLSPPTALTLCDGASGGDANASALGKMPC